MREKIIVLQELFKKLRTEIDISRKLGMKILSLKIAYLIHTVYCS